MTNRRQSRHLTPGWVNALIAAGIGVTVAGVVFTLTEIGEIADVFGISLTLIGVVVSAGVAIWDNGSDSQ